MPQVGEHIASHLEPAASDMARSGCDMAAGSIAEISAAISLKRIADILEGNLSVGGFANFEQLAWSMGQSFENGRGAA